MTRPVTGENIYEMQEEQDAQSSLRRQRDGGWMSHNHHHFAGLAKYSDAIFLGASAELNITADVILGDWFLLARMK